MKTSYHVGSFINHSKKQAGFTLIEMLVAITVASMMMMTMSEALAPALAFYGKRETDARLADIQIALISAYKEHSKIVDTNPNAEFETTKGKLVPVLPNSDGRCLSDLNTFQVVGQYLSSSATSLWADGHGQGFCIFINPRQSQLRNGVKFDFHTIAVVSAGYDGAVDAATKLNLDGSLTLGGDDKGVLVDGKKLVGDYVDRVYSQINQAGLALSNYFMVRYQSNPTRDISVNYFANTNISGDVDSYFDSGGLIQNTRGVEQSLTSINAHTALGLSVYDVTDPWGGLIYLDNSSDSVRHPQNSNPSLRSPGFTARIGVNLPNGEKLQKTIVGSY